MFDALWILDKGGRPIYTGNPIDAVVYFRRAVWQAGTEECLCPRCGNVNPEQIFDTIETKQLDEKGYPTAERRFSPETWHHRHQKVRQADAAEPVHSGLPPAKALTSWGSAPMFAGHKQIGNIKISTFHFNLMVLWLASGLLYGVLLFHNDGSSMATRILRRYRRFLG